MKVRLLALTFGFILAAGGAWAGPTPGGPDTDSDGVENAFDNCRDTSNASQTDTDHNGCGDTCTQSIVCDANGDTTVGLPDFLALGMEFGHTVGPSGITNAQCTPSTCRCTPQ